MTAQPLVSSFAQRLDPDASARPARVVRPLPGACEPLYAATRVLSGDALALERGLAQAREELRATRACRGTSCRCGCVRSVRSARTRSCSS